MTLSSTEDIHLLWDFIHTLVLYTDVPTFRIPGILQKPYRLTKHKHGAPGFRI